MVFGVGALLAPQLVHYVEIATGSGTGVFYAAVLLAASMAVVTFLLPTGAAPPRKAEELSAASKGEARGRMARNLSAPSLGVDLEPSGQVAWRALFQMSFLSLIFSNVSIELGFGSWIYTYCVRQVGLSEAAGQQITSLYWLVFTIGRLPAVSFASSDNKPL